MDDTPLDILTRWERSGGEWRVEAQRQGQLTIALLRCDGGEEADRLVSADDSLVAYVAGRTRGPDA